MLRVANKPIMVSAVMLNADILSVVALQETAVYDLTKIKQIFFLNIKVQDSLYNSSGPVLLNLLRL
jgi:hypothetical protein